MGLCVRNVSRLSILGKFPFREEVVVSDLEGSEIPFVESSRMTNIVEEFAGLLTRTYAEMYTCDGEVDSE
jgi:hypothetical protein